MSKDGGPAFPRAEVEFSDGIVANGASGMSLRDYFAGQALAGLVYAADVPDDSAVARYAYSLADAMLKAREAK